jgi:hypothetical protein
MLKDDGVVALLHASDAKAQVASELDSRYPVDAAQVLAAQQRGLLAADSQDAS